MSYELLVRGTYKCKQVSVKKLSTHSGIILLHEVPKHKNTAQKVKIIKLKSNLKGTENNFIKTSLTKLDHRKSDSVGSFNCYLVH